MPAPSRLIFLAGLIGTAALAFADGFAASSATATPIRAAPIVNVDAWNETAPGPPARISATDPAPRCNQWEVSDTAMEEVLREMQRRGWRQPDQGHAITSLASLGVEGIGPVDPDAPMPKGDAGNSLITALTHDEAEQIRTQQVTRDQLIVEGEAIPPRP
jgi:hypothetical protein